MLGKTFQVEGLAAVSGLGAAQLEPLLDALRRKEIFSVTEDPRSPEQGQYGFVQELLRTVAYETLGRRDRKARHLATARHLESLPVADELIEVIAAHQLDAYRAMPDDGDDVRDIARESLLRAAQRAASLAAKAEAMRLVLQAVELTDSDRDRAELQQRAAQLALSAGLVEECEALAGEAITLLEAGGDPTAAAAAHVVRAEARFLLQRPDEAAAEMEDAYAVMSTQPPDAEFANLAAQLGRMRMFISGADPAIEPIERAIEVAEALQLPRPLSNALNTKAVLLTNTRPEEARSLLEGALRIALENDEPEAAMRAYFNLSFISDCWGRPSAEFDRAGLALARRLGERQWERSFLMHEAGDLFRSGDWDRSIEAVRELLDSNAGHDAFVESASAYPLACILGYRGDFAAARQALADSGGSETSPDVQSRASWTASAAAVATAEGDLAGAVRLSRIAHQLGPALGPVHSAVVWGTTLLAENLLATGETAEARLVLEELDGMPVGLRAPRLDATRAMLRARLGAGDEDAEFGEAIAILRGIGYVWAMASTIEAYGHSLERRGRDGSTQFSEARGNLRAGGSGARNRRHRRSDRCDSGPLSLNPLRPSRAC